MSEVLRGYWNTYFKAGSFLRNLSIVMSGTALAQIFSFAMMPVISRLFTAEDFGVFGTFQSILGVVSAGITLQYIQAIVLPKEKKDAINVFFASVIAVVLIAVILFVASVLFQDHVLGVINLPAIWYVYLAILASLIAGMNQAFQAWCIRVKAFKHTSLSQVIRSIISSGIFLVAGSMHIGALGLILGTIIANTAASLNLARVFVADLVNFRKDVSRKKIVEVANEYRDFPLYAAPQNLMNALSQGLPVLLLGHFYGIEVAGFYAFGVKMLQAPMGLVLNPLRQVLFQKATETYNQGGDLFRLYIKTTAGLVAVAFVPSLVLFIWAPQIFLFVFGEAWFEAGVYARWLVLWLFIGFSNVPSVLFARILRQQRNLFIYECVILGTRIAILVLGGIYFSQLSTIIFFSVLGFVLNLFLIFFVGVLIYRSWRKNVSHSPVYG
jgi:O-antigen/teichoic acid export membrane protein